MARLVGVDLPRDKRVEVALTYIYGIGRTRAQETLRETASTGHPCPGPRRRGAGQAPRLDRVHVQG